ncbi:MAG: hypothetical protein R6U57_01700 [Anaerolineales bacterium]
MILAHPKRLIAIGFVLVVLGFVVPFLMVLKIIVSTFALNFLSYGASISGLLLGILGSAGYVQLRKQEDEWKDWKEGE